MSSQVKANWKRDFPVPVKEDSHVRRRDFTRFLGLASIGFVSSSFALAFRKLWLKATSRPSAGVRVADVNEIAIGGYKLFRYPTPDDPCILLRLDSDRFAAFNQSCTHLSCPVHFDSETMQLQCPCHKGSFNAEDGRPVAGPPRRALPSLSVSVRKRDVWVGLEDSDSAAI
jgi:Rieske Fe-S protein